MPVFSAQEIGYDVFTNKEDRELRNKLVNLGDVLFFSDQKGGVIWPVEAYNVLAPDEMSRCQELFIKMSKVSPPR